MLHEDFRCQLTHVLGNVYRGELFKDRLFNACLTALAQLLRLFSRQMRNYRVNF